MEKISKEEIKITILNYLKRKGSMHTLAELAIYKKDTLMVYAVWYTMKKDGIIKEVKGVSYLV